MTSPLFMSTVWMAMTPLERPDSQEPAAQEEAEVRGAVGPVPCGLEGEQPSGGCYRACS